MNSSNKNPNVLKSINDNMDNLMKLDSPDISYYKKNELKDWAFSSMFAYYVNNLIKKVNNVIKDDLIPSKYKLIVQILIKI